MELRTTPSIRQQFLTKIYRRNNPTSQEFQENENKIENNEDDNEILIKNPEIQKLQHEIIITTPEKRIKRSATPSIDRGKSPLALRNSNGMHVFAEFLTELLDSSETIPPDVLKKSQTITKSLNENFAKNPEFSLQFYIAMTGIINQITEPGSFVTYDLKLKIEEALSMTIENDSSIELTNLKKSISKMSLKVVTVRFYSDIKKTFVSS